MNSSTIIAASTLIAGGACAQSNISPLHKFSWSENCGWMNWADAGSPARTQGAVLAGTFASGFVWTENTGWLNLGDGTPANASSYVNATGADFGVNIGPDGALSGLAWGENIGWCNFTLPTLPVNQRPRLDPASGRLRGYAWSENVGWLNLDSADHFVGIHCPADFNEDGVVDFFDYLDFVDAFSANNPTSDFNHDASIDFFDYLDFVDAFSRGC